MCFVLQIPSSVVRHVRAIYSTVFLLKHLYRLGKFACWYFVDMAKKPGPQAAAPLLSESCTDLAGHKHKLPQGKVCQHLRLRLAQIQSSLSHLHKPSSIPQTFQMRGETASLEEMLLLHYSFSQFWVFHGQKAQECLLHELGFMRAIYVSNAKCIACPAVLGLPRDQGVAS